MYVSITFPMSYSKFSILDGHFKFMNTISFALKYFTISLYQVVHHESCPNKTISFYPINMQIWDYPIQFVICVVDSRSILIDVNNDWIYFLTNSNHFV